MKKTPYIIFLLAVLVLVFVTCQKRPEMKIYNLEINEENVETTATSVEITVHYTYPTKLEYVNVYLSINGDLSNSTIVQATIDQNTFTTTFSNLLENTRYFYRFEYSNGVNLIKTDIHNFTTLGYSLPSVTTANITEITANSAVCGGNVIYNGGANVTARGVCWSTEPNPTISNNYTSNGLGNGEFNSELTNLEANVKYYVRAYATNSYGTSYGDEKEFTTVMGSPSVTTKSVTNITVSTATCGGNVTNDGGGTITTRGVCWSTTSNPTIAHNHTTDGTGVGEFTSYITELDNNTTYYVRAYAISSYGTAYGEERSFTTQEGLAVVTTADVTSITATSAVSGGNITDDGGFSITARGVCWSTSQDPTTNESHTSDGTGTGSYTSTLTSLSYNTTYYVRAYATNSKGTSYGEEKTFTTSKLVPTVTTAEVSGVTTTSAVCGGNVTDDGGASVIARGVCWGTSQNPTVSGSHTSDGNGIGTFTSNITGLSENTTYYVRAYATNSEGTSYGAEKTFSTTHSVSLPEVTTTDVTNITVNTAVSGGNVTSSGFGTVSAKGVCWSTSQNPTIDDMHTTDGFGTGVFVSNIIGLAEYTTYYVRAYATNETGTAYGEEKVFTTLHVIEMPVVTTDSITNITYYSAISGGNVLSDGYGTISARGVCWSTNQNPTISDAHTTDGSGLGLFTSYITEINGNTTYYVRAYATNDIGTTYGEQKSFTTDPEPPIGAINGLFSINSNGGLVYISQGNLQYQASTGIWRFAEEQYDCAGYDNSSISSTYDGWIDIYGWATSGFNNKYPYMVSTSVTSYGYGQNNISGTNYDWGVYNPISNGGNVANQWRTPTVDELTYIFNTRNTASGIRYAKGNVNNVNGVILLPDNWNSNYYELYNVNNGNTSFNTNIITAEQWSVMEQLGAVFFPAAGLRFGTSYGELGEVGGYWSSTHESYDNAYNLEFGDNGLNIYPCSRDRARSVRLVRDAEN